MDIQLSDHFTNRKLLKFTTPSILMKLFLSVFGVVDGFFISNLVGKTAFAAINLIIPFLLILGSVGFMLGAGGSALVAKTMGEGDLARANKLFSLFIWVTAVGGVLFSCLCFFLLEPAALFLGAQGDMLGDALVYGRIFLIGLPFFMLQGAFQYFLITAGKPQLGMVISVLSGLTNVGLDALFMIGFGWGVAGAAAATAVGLLVGAVIPAVYFLRPNDSSLRLTRGIWDGKALLKASGNGASELLSNIALSVISMLYNWQLLRYAGADGVAAYGVMMYVNTIFLSLLIGYSTGVSPVLSYHLGAKNPAEITSLLKKSLVILLGFSLLILVLTLSLARPIAAVYVGYDEGLMALTLRGFRLYSISFLFAGFGIFGSAFFTALNDGVTSAVIAFLRTCLFQALAVLALPLVLGVDGIWLSIALSEILATILSLVLIRWNRKKYNY